MLLVEHSHRRGEIDRSVPSHTDNFDRSFAPHLAELRWSFFPPFRVVRIQGSIRGDVNRRMVTSISPDPLTMMIFWRPNSRVFLR